MKFVALLSGGKDSCYNILKCQAYGHELVCLANLLPSNGAEEINSFMYQSAAHNAIPSLAECFDVPLLRRATTGQAKVQTMDYDCTPEDEVEDLFELLKDVVERFPEVEGVSCGAIVSNYQRVRLENICSRLGLTSLCYLWQRCRRELLNEIVGSGVHAVLVKVAGAGLEPRKHLGKDLGTLTPTLMRLHDKYGLDLCGEGGEYETLVLDCPSFKSKRVIILESAIELDEEDESVGNYCIRQLELVEKTDCCPSSSTFPSSSPSPSPDTPDTAPIPPPPSLPTATAETSSSIASPPSLSAVLPSVSAGVGCKGAGAGSVTVGMDGLGHTGLILPHSQTDSVSEQVTQVLDALAALLASAAAGCRLADVCFVSLYLSTMSDFDTVNQAYCRAFDASSPHARCCTQVRLPSGCAVGLQAYFSINSSSIPRRLNDRSNLQIKSVSEWAPVCIGPYCQAVTLHQSLLFIAGQISLDPATMRLWSGGPGGLASRLRLQLALSLRHVCQIMAVSHASCDTVLSVVLHVNRAAVDTLGSEERVDWDQLVADAQCLLSREFDENKWIPDDLVGSVQAAAGSWMRRCLPKPASTSGAGAEEGEGEEEDEEQEEWDNESDRSSLSPSRLLPVLVVAAESLPRGALVEAEVVASTTQVEASQTRSRLMTGVLSDSGSARDLSFPPLTSDSCRSWPVWGAGAGASSSSCNSGTRSNDGMSESSSQLIAMPDRWSWTDVSASSSQTAESSSPTAVADGRFFTHATYHKRCFCVGQVVFVSPSVGSLNVIGGLGREQQSIDWSEVARGLVSGMVQQMALAEVHRSSLRSVRLHFRESLLDEAAEGGGVEQLTTSFKEALSRVFGHAVPLVALPTASILTSSSSSSSSSSQNHSAQADFEPSSLVKGGCLAVQFMATDCLQMKTAAWIWQGRR